MNSKKNSTKIPDKKTMNLCMRDESATDWTTLGIGLAIILVMVFLVAKWGVIDQYARLNEAENAYIAAKEKNDSVKEIAERYPEVLQEYRLYGREWLNDGTVKDTVSLERTEMLDLFEKILMKRGVVKEISAYGDSVSVKMSGMNLDSISDMLDDLREYDCVAGANLNSASTEKDDLGNLLDFTISVYLKAEEAEQ